MSSDESTQELLDALAKVAHVEQFGNVVSAHLRLSLLRITPEGDLLETEGEIRVRRTNLRDRTTSYRQVQGQGAVDFLTQQLSAKDSAEGIQMRLLYISSLPYGDNYVIEVDEEFRRIQKALEGAKFGINIIHKSAARPEDVASGLRKHDPTHLHFAGRGTPEGLYLRGRDKEQVEVTPDSLIGIIKPTYTRPLECIYLNACYTMPHVLALTLYSNYSIGFDGIAYDVDALVFAEWFYEAIKDGLNPKSAFDTANGLINVYGPSPNFAPILKSSSIAQ